MNKYMMKKQIQAYLPMYTYIYTYVHKDVTWTFRAHPLNRIRPDWQHALCGGRSFHRRGASQVPASEFGVQGVVQYKCISLTI